MKAIQEKSNFMKNDIWLDENDLSLDDNSDAFSYPPLIRCIKAEQSWDAQADTNETLCQLAELEFAVDEIRHKHVSKHKCLDEILDAFYTLWLFSGSSQKVPEYKLNSVCYALSMRSGTNTALGLILVHLLERAKLEASLALSQGEIIVHVAFSEEEGYVIEPSSGHQSWYIIPENENNQDKEQEKDQEPMELIFNEESLKLYLSQQKWAFIAAEKFGHALSCVEQLMDILGDDPYERRDRGYLLNQLNCPKMAKDDLQFFVDECPDDPTIEVIQHQIKELADHNNILH
ncbi:tetratricopeptide repeat protein [Pseudoalteromonas sp. S2755]|uniref:tetratricopeptide repeat protein n=1 Tax=Pseudoalteromonas sp. S2755 TaxID=2066523 RepID=UPI00110AA409|nr:tetratricopeptide repeat protein [Pseudoalteromonas sp. S2755]TMN33476.1 transcriptional regulator [Pseudoalteromonas sp. S2755]